MVPEQWLERCHEFAQFHIMKYHRIFQSLIYLTKFKERAEVCEYDTNKLSWKLTKQFLHSTNPESPDLFATMGSYLPFGSKDDEYFEYQKLMFVKTNIEGFNEEALEEFSVALFKLYQWLNMTLATRIDDVLKRREDKEREREVRREAVEREEERQERRAEQLDEAKAAWEEALEAANEENDEEGEEGEKEAASPEKKEVKEGEAAEGEKKEEVPKEFDEKDFDKKFDDENPPIDIPPEVLDYIDNDYNLEEPAEEAE